MNLSSLNSDYPHKTHDYNLAVCILASGSKGNVMFVSSGSTSILVDAGLSGIEIERRLNLRGLHPEDLDAILVSHEHTDHIQGVGVLSRRFNLPVYINQQTQKAAKSHLGDVNDFRNYECGSPFRIKDLTIHPFSISHDAEDPAGFTINQDGTKIGIATDLGVASSMVREHLRGCSMLIIESNHDSEMLVNGPYPWPLKQRISSRTGHLSNKSSRNLLKEVQHERLQHVILAHLSETNNTPQKALNEAVQAITDSRVQIEVASQHRCGRLLRLK
jgi:phosphoribosyl 1,2-cyclic phosphodiesterase